MVYKINEIPHMSSPVIRPRFSMGMNAPMQARAPVQAYAASQNQVSKFRVLDNVEILSEDQKKYCIAAVVLVILSLIYIYKYKPAEVQDASDPSGKTLDNQKVFVYGVFAPALVGFLSVYIYENYIKE